MKELEIGRQLADWARRNTNVTHDSDDLVMGHYNDYRYRIFIYEGWAGIKNGNSWLKAKAFYNVNDFIAGLFEGKTGL